MDLEEVAAFIRGYLRTAPLDVEIARGEILEYLSELGEDATASSGQLTTQVRQRLYSQGSVFPHEHGAILPELNSEKAKIVAAEALQHLQANGAVVAFGGLKYTSDMVTFTHTNTGRSGPVPGLSLYQPVVYDSYRIASAFRVGRYRLADGDLFLSRMNRKSLPSRAERCLRECIDAFRHGLFLSATMNLGAASESLWMELGRRVNAKPPITKLDVELRKAHPSIGQVIDLTWETMQSHRSAELKLILTTPTDQKLFKDQTDRLRDRRNFAMHDDAADVDEPLFTYGETGLLLLDAANYFNKLIELLAVVAHEP